MKAWMSMTTATSPPPVQMMKMKQGQSCRFVFLCMSPRKCFHGTQDAQICMTGYTEVHMCVCACACPQKQQQQTDCVPVRCVLFQYPTHLCNSQTVLQFCVALQSDGRPDRANGHLSKDQELEAKAGHHEADGEADMEVGMDGDVASIKTKPAEAECALPTNKQAEQTSPVRPNPKERLAGEHSSQHVDCLQWLLSATCEPYASHVSASICQLHHLCCHWYHTHWQEMLTTSFQPFAHLHKQFGHCSRKAAAASSTGQVLFDICWGCLQVIYRI